MDCVYLNVSLDNIQGHSYRALEMQSTYRNCYATYLSWFTKACSVVGLVERCCVGTFRRKVKVVFPSFSHLIDHFGGTMLSSL